MAQSLSVNLVHLIYSTKHREARLLDTIRPKLFAYQAGIYKASDSPAITIGGTDDHVHALFMLSKNLALCDLIEEVKKGSSKWLKTQGSEFAEFHWQNGYGAFSLSQSHVARARSYIDGQAEHHRTVTFQDEFRLFLKRYRVEYDERYVWD
jgi:REP element-mobilizing transposase RayT